MQTKVYKSVQAAQDAAREKRKDGQKVTVEGNKIHFIKKKNRKK